MPWPVHIPLSGQLAPWWGWARQIPWSLDQMSCGSISTKCQSWKESLDYFVDCSMAWGLWASFVDERAVSVMDTAMKLHIGTHISHMQTSFRLQSTHQSYADLLQTLSGCLLFTTPGEKPVNVILQVTKQGDVWGKHESERKCESVSKLCTKSCSSFRKTSHILY